MDNQHIVVCPYCLCPIILRRHVLKFKHVVNANGELFELGIQENEVNQLLRNGIVFGCGQKCETYKKGDELVAIMNT